MKKFTGGIYIFLRKKGKKKFNLVQNLHEAIGSGSNVKILAQDRNGLRIGYMWDGSGS